MTTHPSRNVQSLLFSISLCFLEKEGVTCFNHTLAPTQRAILTRGGEQDSFKHEAEVGER